MKWKYYWQTRNHIVYGNNLKSLYVAGQYKNKSSIELRKNPKIKNAITIQLNLQYDSSSCSYRLKIQPIYHNDVLYYTTEHHWEFTILGKEMVNFFQHFCMKRINYSAYLERYYRGYRCKAYEASTVLELRPEYAAYQEEFEYYYKLLKDCAPEKPTILENINMPTRFWCINKDDYIADAKWAKNPKLKDWYCYRQTFATMIMLSNDKHKRYKIRTFI